MKTCSKCGATKPFDQFWSNSSSKDGKRAACIECSRPYNKAYYAANREALRAQGRAYQVTNAEAIKAQRLQATYGITPADYEQRLSTQRGQCANPACTNEAAVIDHDHSCCPDTGSWRRSCGRCIRGLLCSGCNLALGHLDDDIDRLRGLETYLQDYRVDSVMATWGTPTLVALGVRLCVEPEQ